ncbi:hypothetical protein MK139_12375, partial [bacterium]|nr:hypothetical protein [bacterium]
MKLLDDRPLFYSLVAKVHAQPRNLSIDQRFSYLSIPYGLLKTRSGDGPPIGLDIRDLTKADDTSIHHQIQKQILGTDLITFMTSNRRNPRWANPGNGHPMELDFPYLHGTPPGILRSRPRRAQRPVPRVEAHYRVS